MTYPKETEKTYPKGTEKTYPKGTERTYPKGTERTYPKRTERTYPKGTERTYPKGTEKSEKRNFRRKAAPNVTALNAVTALSNPNGLLIHLQCVSCFRTGERPSHYLQCPVVHNLQPSTQYSFVEAACTTAGCQTGGVVNVTTLDSVRDVGTSFDGRGLATFSGHVFLCGFINQATVQFHTYNPSGILFYQINSVMTDFLGVKPHGGLPWLIFYVGYGPAVVGSNSTRTFNDGQWHTVSFRTHRSC
ncbi:hypothetical protein EMCRGX_G003584 [Ephydatia muelleri]